MTYLCVPITVESVDAALAEASAARDAGADLVEFRIDEFVSGGVDPESIASVKRLAAQSPVPCIVTCRDSAEGGAYGGNDADRAGLLNALIQADHPPRYIDLELAAIERSPELRACAAQLAHRESPRLILSMHDFAERPADLSRKLARLRSREGESITKIAYRARSLRDNLELFEILSRRDRPTIALAMGEFGLLSRALAPKFGGFLTFASLRPESVTAPGQPTVRELLEMYRFRALGAATRVFGVIGWPVSQSLSPLIHNAGFEARAFDGVYLPMPIPSEWEHFKATLGAMVDDPRLDFSGASVTIPHKEHLVRFASEHASEGWSIEPLALAAGAANTIVRSNRGWRTMNTDAPAIVSCVRSAIDDLRDTRIAIVGAGGAARAGAAGLLAEGATVVLYNRTLEKAERIVQELSSFASRHGGQIVAAPLDRVCKACAHVIINTTPIGMTDGPEPHGHPVDLGSLEQAPNDLVVFDTVYNPMQTPLLAEAHLRGLRTIDGVEMFIRQAALQFEAWTGGPAPIDLFDRLVRDRLGANA